MKQFRFFDLDLEEYPISTALHNLCSDINSIQSAYRFLYNGDVLPGKKKWVRQNIVSSNEVERHIERLVASKRIFGQFPVFVCNYKFEDDLYTVFDPDYGIITINNWLHLQSSEIRNNLLMTIVGMIVNIYEFHMETHCPDIGCPSDYGAFGDLSLSIQTADYCDDCKRVLNAAVQDGILPLKDKSAIYKLLDQISKRKNCFVLMPFDSMFDDVCQ